MGNALDRFGLSPLASVEEITAAMREQAEDAPEAERAALREAWEELTMHPRARLRAAIFTSPPRPGSIAEGRAPLPPLTAGLSRPSATDATSAVPLADLLPRPLVSAAFGGLPIPAARALPRWSEDPVIASLRDASPSTGARKT
jgi:hypothetical protein